jgi:hypothetical protein
MSPILDGKRTERPAGSRQPGFRVRLAFLLPGMLAPMVLLWGCSGFVSGKPPMPPPTPQTFSISGTLGPVAGGSGATVTLSGARAATQTADSSGKYIFNGLANGTYAVTPSHTGYTFSPNSQAATIHKANVTGVNFTGTTQGATYSISGTISPAVAANGTAVMLSGTAAATTVTNASGNYTFSGLAKGTYTLTPSNSGYSFTPASHNVTINAAQVTGVNFSGTAQKAHAVALSWNASTSTVSGYNVYRSIVSGFQYARLNSSLVGGLAYNDMTVQNGIIYYYVTTAVDASGVESAYSQEVSANIP